MLTVLGHAIFPLIPNSACVTDIQQWTYRSEKGGQVTVAETLWDYIQDVIGKNIASISAVTTKVFRAFPQSIQTKASIAPKLGHKRSFPFFFFN
jgi:hypothetical protein